MAWADVDLPCLGVGVTYSGLLDPILDPGVADVLEIEPQAFWIRSIGGDTPYQFPEAAIAHIDELPGRKLIHSVGAPVGGSVRPDDAHLALLKQTVDRFESPWASDHLSFNATPEFSTGFFLPPRQTAANIEPVARNIRALRQALNVPLAVETGVNYLQPRSDELPDGEFVARVVEAADCGVLLDIHNIFANALNQGQRTLTSLRRKDLHQELVVPACDSALSLDAVLGRVTFQQADREAAEPGEVVCDAPFPRATVVFVEGHI